MTQHSNDPVTREIADIQREGFPADYARHPVVVTDDGIIPTCDICDGPQRVEGDDWNGETGNHRSCEEDDRPEDQEFITPDVLGLRPAPEPERCWFYLHSYGRAPIRCQLADGHPETQGVRGNGHVYD